MVRIIIPCLMMEISEQTKEHKWHHRTSVDRIPGVSWLYPQLQLQQTWPVWTVLTPCPWKNVWLAGWLVYMCKLYQSISKWTHYPSIKRWPLAKKTKNTTQKQLRFLMPQTSGHAQVSQSQSSSSAHVPGQSQTLSFTKPRCSNETSYKKCCKLKLYIVHLFVHNNLPSKKPCRTLPNPSRNWVVRSNCQEVDIGSEAVAQGLAVPYREWLRLLSQWLESYRRTKDQRVPKSIGLRFPGCMFSIIWPIMLSTSNCSLVPHFPTIITPKRDARRIFHGEISEKCWNLVVLLLIILSGNLCRELEIDSPLFLQKWVCYLLHVVTQKTFCFFR
jgi:hypothetical protein